MDITFLMRAKNQMNEAKLSLTHKEVDYIRKIKPKDSILTLPVPPGYEPIFAECEDTFRDIDQMIAGTLYFPQRQNIFKALELTPFDKIRVIIIAQDPYPNVFANGLAFSTCEKKIPRSLCNIFKELKKEYYRFKIPKHGDLSWWAKQGVLLLNASLTVEPDKPLSHGRMWTHLIIEIIKQACIMRESQDPGPSGNNKRLIFLLWGAKAQQYEDQISDSSIKLKSAHPVSRANAKTPFIGNGHFLETNRYLVEMDEEPIDWNLPETPELCIQEACVSTAVEKEEEEIIDEESEDTIEEESESISYDSE